MTDTTTLRSIITNSGLKYKAIAEIMGLTPYSLQMKIDNETEFKASEIDTLANILGMDMQRDTIVSSLHSYSLGDAPGVVGHIDRIESVVVNGKVLCEGGYLDIGLFDTIGDMAIESLGALVLAVAGLCDRGRHPAFRRVTAAEAGAGTALTE